jgi:hypothetical protein
MQAYGGVDVYIHIYFSHSLPVNTEGRHENTQLRYLVSGLRFETRTQQIEIRSANHLAETFVIIRFFC